MPRPPSRTPRPSTETSSRTEDAGTCPHQITYGAVPLAQDGWLLVTPIPDEVIRQGRQGFFLSIIIVSVLVLIAAFYLGLRLASNLSIPLKALDRAMKRIGRGELAPGPTVLTGDEVGRLASSFYRMKQILRTLLSRTREATDEISSASNQILAAAREQSAGNLPAKRQRQGDHGRPWRNSAPRPEP